MSNSIKLSEKYGVNPTIPVCFFCRIPKNEIALLGHIGDKRKGEDFEAPHYVVLDYEPCDCCKDKFSQGVLLLKSLKHNLMTTDHLFLKVFTQLVDTL